MYVLYNNELIEATDLPPFFENRSFLYGDSLFETMIYRNKKIQFLEDHLKRLHEGIELLHFSFSVKKEILTQKIDELLKLNNIQSAARIRLQVWRKPGGYYTPVTNETDYIVTVEKYERSIYQLKQVNFCENTIIYYTPFSKFKIGNKLPSILASIEKKERQLDDVILLNQKQHIAEAPSSNIFWEKDNIFYTPSLQTGCIDGVMRKNIILFLKKENYSIERGEYLTSKLMRANSAFLCNVTGIYPIQQIENRIMNIHAICDRLNFTFSA